MSNASVAKQPEELIGSASVAACYAEGLDALEHGDLISAQRCAQRCAALPDAASDPRYAALQGRIAAAQGDFSQAADFYQTAAALAPHEIAFSRQLAEALQVNGESDQALAVLEKITEQEPRHPELFIDLAFARLIRGNRQGAREAIERAALLRPNDQALQFSRAEVYEAIGEPALAAEILGQLLSENQSPRLSNHLARLFLKLEAYDRAELCFRSLGEHDPAAGLLAQHGLIWCRLKNTDWRGAFEAALDAARLDRFGTTTSFLSYAKDRVFGGGGDLSQREAELLQRLGREIDEYAELHHSDPIATHVAGGN